MGQMNKTLNVFIFLHETGSLSLLVQVQTSIS